MRLIILFLLLISTGVFAQTVPPTKVLQPDGTIQLVPVPPAFVYTPYYIDPIIKYRLYLESGWAQKSWNGGVKNGQYGFKDSIITANILAMPLPTPPLTLMVNGIQKQVYKWSIYRNSDVIIQYDYTRLELLPTVENGIGFDPTVMDASKTKITTLGDGLIVYHGEVLKAPELRIPALKPQYYQWNFDGYLWQGGYRLLGTLQFKVKDDYYLPSWGSQRSFIRVLPSTTYQGATITTKIDGSPTVGTNVLGEIRSEGEQIMFGAPPIYKVAHYLSAPTTKFKAGDTVPVKIMVKPETKPQFIASVSTNFVWDNTVLELMSINTTGAPKGMVNGFPLVGATNINEVTIPKDGNARHSWLCEPGDKSYRSGEVLIVTLNFKVLNDFNTTKIDIVKKDDPSLTGLLVSDESQPLGSNIPGSSILGNQTGIILQGNL